MADEISKVKEINPLSILQKIHPKLFKYVMENLYPLMQIFIFYISSYVETLGVYDLVLMKMN
ncbi:hypothetical protein HanRHA438_Chr14g0666761 [Helianthus annuus]|nr:hypothetical protein HanRHA438_Chr14g0666761 [Helianthus annuus]